MQYNFKNLQEESEEGLKTQIREIFFPQFESKIIGKIDFCIYSPIKDSQNLFKDNDLIISHIWAEAKKGIKTDNQLLQAFVQLILTIGREKTHTKYNPPKFLATFDAEKIIFIPYECIKEVLSKTDFNWNITPSDYNSNEFEQLFNIVESQIRKEQSIFYYGRNDKDTAILKEFIKQNLTQTDKIHKIQVNNNNFVFVYHKWEECVKPSISVNWQELEKLHILSGDFFLADLMSENNKTILDNLLVILNKDFYQIDKKENPTSGLTTYTITGFSDNGEKHTQFWNIYERPPKDEFIDKIIERRDLLVPQDIRERKGSFFTPQIWVEKSQEYLEKTLGQNWQDEYYIWDCAAGTGNLLVNLTKNDRIFASTIDKADVDVIRESKTLNLLKGNVFQFDFLNDSLESNKIPQRLKDILSNEKEREKLLIFINPPYAEATNTRTISRTGNNKAGVSNETTIAKKYKEQIGNATNELYAQFLFRIQNEIKGCKIGQFSKLKHLNASNFAKFRQVFNPKFLGGFCVPGYTFDNVRGKFPIGFMVWDTLESQKLESTKLDVFGAKGESLGVKKFISNSGTINKWIRKFDTLESEAFCYLPNMASDYQHNKNLYTSTNKGIQHVFYTPVARDNLIPCMIYFSVRHCIKANWLNDRDQFYAPKSNKWAKDDEFQGDCLIFALFHNQNKISAKEGKNYLNPFFASEIGAPSSFEPFLKNFMLGKIKADSNKLFDDSPKIALNGSVEINFSNEAKSVLDIGKEIYSYYYKESQKSNNTIIGASLYDIKEFFKKRDEKGRMNTKSDNKEFNKLEERLKTALELLAKKIATNAYKYGFLDS